MIAHLCNLKPKELIISGGDIHIYKTHIENAHIQINRAPKYFPTLKIKGNKENIDHFKFEDFEIIDYDHHGSLKYEMAV